MIKSDNLLRADARESLLKATGIRLNSCMSVMCAVAATIL
jgi:hypothetical protein